MPWELNLEPEAAGSGPRFVAISRAVVLAIRSGRLAPGDALPGSRALAEALHVHRNTVLAALRELEREGWVEARQGKGTFVRRSLPEAAPRALRGAAPQSRDPARVAFSMRGAAVGTEALRHHFGAAAVADPKLLKLVGGLPDLRLLPRSLLAREHRRATSAAGSLSYGDPFGDALLREQLASMLGRTRGIGHAERGLVVTRGSQMGLFLAATALLERGDVVAVEALGYRPAWEALRLAGARLAAIPVDRDGLRVDLLLRLCERERVRAVYVTPHHQYPTTARLSPGRRMALLEQARARGLAVFEDDYDHEFHYDGRPTLPLASADAHGAVVYIGTLSKVLAPGLRLGFVVAPEPLALRMAQLRTFMDRQGDLVTERATGELLRDGELLRHVRKMKRVYHARRDALVSSLRRHLGDVLTFKVPEGGLAIWARASRAVDVDAWAARALEAGVLVHTARRFAFDGRAHPSLRLGFAPLDEREIERAVVRLAGALRPSPTKIGPSRAPSRTIRS